MNRPLPPATGGPRGLRLGSILGRLVAGITMLAALVAGVMFSAVLIVVAVVGGLLFAGYVWWTRRKLMKQLRDDPAFADLMQQRQPPPRSDVIEGEVLRSEWQDRERP